MKRKGFVFVLFAIVFEVAGFLLSRYALLSLLGPLGAAWMSWAVIFPLLFLFTDWLLLLNYYDYIRSTPPIALNFYIAGGWSLTAILSGWLHWAALTILLAPFTGVSSLVALVIVVIVTVIRFRVAIKYFPRQRA